MARKSKCVKVVVAAPKGGVGKSTMTMALLVLASKHGLRVLGVNTDEQMSLMKWDARRRQQARRQESGLVMFPIRHMSIHEFRKLSDITDYDVVIVDTPPGHSEVYNSVISLCELADIILVPTTPSTVDVDEVVPFYQAIAGTRAFFVLNAVNRRARSYMHTRQYLLTKGKLCSADVPRLESIGTQYGRGLSCTDLGDPGAEDFQAVWNFICHEVGLKVETGVVESAHV